MGPSESLLPEFDNEMANTRKTLERVPKTGRWPKQWTAMGGMATHVSNIPTWTMYTIDKD